MYEEALAKLPCIDTIRPDVSIVSILPFPSSLQRTGVNKFNNFRGGVVTIKETIVRTQGAVN